jgi:hypothetical protein
MNICWATMDYGCTFQKIKTYDYRDESQYAPGQPYTTKWKLTPQKQLLSHFLGFEAGHKKTKLRQAIGCIMTGQNLSKDISYLKEYKSVKDHNPDAILSQKYSGTL